MKDLFSHSHCTCSTVRMRHRVAVQSSSCLLRFVVVGNSGCVMVSWGGPSTWLLPLAEGYDNFETNLNIVCYIILPIDPDVLLEKYYQASNHESLNPYQAKKNNWFPTKSHCPWRISYAVFKTIQSNFMY